MMGRVEFEAGGIQHYLKLSTNAHVRYQRHCGETLLAGIGAVQKNAADVDRLRSLFWVAMSHVEGLTEDQAGDIMDEVGINIAIELLSAAVNEAYPAPKKEAVGNAQGSKAKPVSPKAIQTA